MRNEKISYGIKFTKCTDNRVITDSQLNKRAINVHKMRHIYTKKNSRKQIQFIFGLIHCMYRNLLISVTNGSLRYTI